MDLLKDFEAVNEKEKLTEKYPLYSQDKKHGNTTVILKYFFPAGAATWYVTEVSREGDYITFFGLVTGLVEDELGYFTLNELADLVVDAPIHFRTGTTGEEFIKKIPTRIERDLYFTPCRLDECAPDFCRNLWKDDYKEEGSTKEG